MHKYVMAILLSVACIMGIVYSFEAINEAKKAQADEIVEDNELRIIADEFFFDQEEYTVVQGEPMKLSLRNKKGLHSAKINGIDIEIFEDEVLEYTFDTPGTYEIVCGISCGLGHLDMVAKLVVLEAGEIEESNEETAAVQ